MYMTILPLRAATATFTARPHNLAATALTEAQRNPDQGLFRARLRKHAQQEAYKVRRLKAVRLIAPLPFREAQATTAAPQ